MRRTSVCLLFALTISSCLAQYPGAQKTPSSWRKGFDSIKQEDAQSILNFLAGPTFNGRNAFNGDFFAAAGFVADQLRAMGLQPGGDKGSFLQRFVLLESSIDPAGTSFKSGDGSVSFAFGNDFSIRGVSDTQAAVKFAFIKASEKADLSQVNWDLVKDRWVVLSSEAVRNPAITEIMLRRNPKVKFDQIIRSSPFGRMGDVGRAYSVKDLPDPRTEAYSQPRFSADAVKAIATKCGAAKFLAEGNETSIETSDVPFELAVKVTSKEIPSTNVVGVLPGSDPKLKDECVLIGSHLDHLGLSNDGIRFGADDNGSGCTANLLVAKAILGNPVRPKRSVVFAFWTLEETGTYGSFAYSMKPTVPLDKTVAYVNMDMVGRNEESGVDIPENNERSVYPGIVRLNSPEFEKLLFDTNRFVNLRLKNDKEDRTERSDTRNFVWRGVPTVKVFTGEHRDYHRAGDTIDKVNFKKLTSVAKWVYLTVQELASDRTRPQFVKTDWKESADVSFQGYAKLPDGVKLPPGAKLVVDLIATAAGSNEVKPLASSTVEAKDARIPYEITLPRTSLNPELNYQLTFRVLVGKKETFVNDSAVTASGKGWTRPQTVSLKPVVGSSDTKL